MVSQEGSGNGTLELATPAATITASSLLLVLLLALVPLWLYLAYRNTTTRSVLYYGWVPVIAAMCISRLNKSTVCNAAGTLEHCIFMRMHVTISKLS